MVWNRSENGELKNILWLIKSKTFYNLDLFMNIKPFVPIYLITNINQDEEK